MNIPSNYRQLRSDETIRPYDRYQSPGGFVNYVKHSIGKTPDSHGAYKYTYWRRTHKRQNLDPVIQKDTATVTRTKSGVSIKINRASTEPIKGELTDKNVVMIRFQYPDSQYHFLRERDVQLISMDATYIVGLEQSAGRRDGKWKWQFKKYLRNKIPYNGVVLTHYGAPIQ